MTTADMLQRVRTFLDEASEDYYLDDEEIYPALAEAQREVLTVVANEWTKKVMAGTADAVPVILEDLVVLFNDALTTGYKTIESLSAPFLAPITLLIDINNNSLSRAVDFIFVGAPMAHKIKQNKQLAKSPIYWQQNKETTQTFTIHFNPPIAGVQGAYELQYVSDIANDIDASHQPEIGDKAHDAICERATWILTKDREMGVAQTHLQVYQGLLQELMK